jgi:uncharacterized protein (DUF983 family)
MMRNDLSSCRIALKGLCPRCGAATLFEGPGAPTRSCRACGLDFAAAQTSGRTGAFITLLIAAALAALALGLEKTVSLPLWLHALLWIPITIGAILFALRFVAAARLLDRYRNSGGDRSIPDR